MKLLFDCARLPDAVHFHWRNFDIAVQTTRKVRSLRYQLRTPPDLIVLELIMPDRDGVQVIAALAKAKLDSAIILVSACPERVLSAAESFARMSGLKVLPNLFTHQRGKLATKCEGPPNQSSGFAQGRVHVGRLL